MDSTKKFVKFFIFFSKLNYIYNNEFQIVVQSLINLTLS